MKARSVKARQWGKFLVKVFDEWVRRDVGTVFVQTFDAALASWCGLPAGVCVFQETCGTALVVEHNGDVYACDHFVEPGHLLGNIMERPWSKWWRHRSSASSGWTRLGSCRQPAGIARCCLPARGNARRDRGRGGRGNNRTRTKCPVRGVPDVLRARGPTDAEDGGTAAVGEIRGWRSWDSRKSPADRSQNNHKP